jgi:hypothetical protein
LLLFGQIPRILRLFFLDPQIDLLYSFHPKSKAFHLTLTKQLIKRVLQLDWFVEHYRFAPII